MSDAPRDLEVPEGWADVRAEMRLQRLGLVAFFLLLAAAVAGLLGPGPLSSRTEAAGPLSIEYDRFTRYHSPATLKIDVARTGGGEVRIGLNRAFLDAVQLESVQPEPLRVELSPEGQTYIFAAPGLQGPASIYFHYQPDKPFRDVKAVVRLEGGPAIPFSQFAYP